VGVGWGLNKYCFDSIFIDLWRRNKTGHNVKQANKNHTIKPPKFYIAGCRILNIIHTRLRHSSSRLNADLFRVHLANDPGCICGCAFEDAIHFILECCL
jgi:hypothetical protein